MESASLSRKGNSIRDLVDMDIIFLRRFVFK